VDASLEEPSTPCKNATAIAVQPPQVDVNGTSSATIIEKIATYYEQLKNQQEALARQQLQHQLYEQQRRRQQEYMQVQQQIQQQYYHQQQHALRMLEQLRKDPGFADQLAAFINHKRVEEANNGTIAIAPVVAEATAAEAPLPPSVAAAAKTTSEVATVTMDQKQRLLNVIKPTLDSRYFKRMSITQDEERNVAADDSSQINDENIYSMDSE